MACCPDGKSYRRLNVIHLLLMVGQTEPHSLRLLHAEFQSAMNFGNRSNRTTKRHQSTDPEAVFHDRLGILRFRTSGPAELFRHHAQFSGNTTGAIYFLLYVATLGGVSISTNGGANWTNYNTANTNRLVANSVYEVYESGGTVYVSSSGGLSTDFFPSHSPPPQATSPPPR